MNFIKIADKKSHRYLLPSLSSHLRTDTITSLRADVSLKFLTHFLHFIRIEEHEIKRTGRKRKKERREERDLMNKILINFI